MEGFNDNETTSTLKDKINYLPKNVHRYIHLLCAVNQISRVGYMIAELLIMMRNMTFEWIIFKLYIFSIVVEKMKIFYDIFSDEEIISDSYNMVEVFNGTIAEVKARFVVKKEGEVDIGRGNAFGGNTEE